MHPLPVTDVWVSPAALRWRARHRITQGDKLISLTILRHMDAEGRGARRLSAPRNAVRRARRGGAGTDSEDAFRRIELGDSAMSKCPHMSQFVLTISENGYGKRSSSFEYRTTDAVARASLRCR